VSMVPVLMPASARARPPLPQLPALVVGQVTHRRPGPVRHAFRHRLYQWLVDLDSIPRQPWNLRAFAHFSSADHLGDPHLTIKRNIQNYLARGGIQLGDRGRVLMLANARVLGHVFDPLSVFWCYDSDGVLACVVAEVHNTYGERHAYLLRPDEAGVAVTGKDFHGRCRHGGDLHSRVHLQGPIPSPRPVAQARLRATRRRSGDRHAQSAEPALTNRVRPCMSQRRVSLADAPPEDTNLNLCAARVAPPPANFRPAIPSSTGR
jgi:Protein of unknown function (DUF1365)